jgi:hypothetical protein
MTSVYSQEKLSVVTVTDYIGDIGAIAGDGGGRP